MAMQMSNGGKATDECFKIRNTGVQARIPHVEGGQMRPNEDLEYLRIPGFPIA